MTGFNTLHHPPTSPRFRVGRLTHQPRSAVDAGEKGNVASLFTANHIIDPRESGELNEGNSSLRLHEEAAERHLLSFISTGEALQRPAANETPIQPLGALRPEQEGVRRGVSPHTNTHHTSSGGKQTLEPCKHHLSHTLLTARPPSVTTGGK